ncbi:circularly permuted type 2 ATP-grasp protein [Occultella kanbiaonis]|uniref:circularly permuted type 2 ATP-grasp protein n=1 Tax=Occultella kanbiaonis TaxID=2675754 RepID=UPI0013D53F45|nr:circularly permuted type 2 ATP-grasp protein [Occultella kanbiaonis]
MTDLLASYRAGGPGHDEMLQSSGAARAAWDQLADLAGVGSWEQLAGRSADVRSLLEDHGVRYGADPQDRPWLLDPLPVLIDEVEWVRLEAAVRQRAQLLDAILTDLYSERRLLSSGAIPAEIVLAHPGFLRAVDGITIPGPHQLFLHAADLARNADGSWLALADRTQAPNGPGYAMENRRVIAQVLAGLYRQARIRRLGPFYHAMRLALHDVAPPSAGDAPRVALLTPGPHSRTTFDQGYLATMLGYPMVEGEDLVVSDGRLWLRSLNEPEPVDVLIRRVDGSYCDPLDLRGDSRLGVPGLVHAARSGAVTVVNTFGSGVLENPALLTYLPRLCRDLLGTDLLLGSAVTYWCGERSMCSHVIANLDRLVLKATDTGGPEHNGWELTVGERADLAVRISAEPHRWVGQEPVDASTTPSVGAGTLEPRSTVLRTFAVARPSGYQVMSGALARVTPEHTQTVARVTLGAVAKDVWILSAEPQPITDTWLRDGTSDAPRRAGASSISAGAAEDLYWFGRYAERTEATIRLIRAVTDRWDDYHLAPASTGGRALAVLTAALEQVTTSGSLSELVIDGTRPGTVAYAVDAMTRSATAVRDQLAGDTWIAMGSIERALNRERARRSPLGSSDGGLGPVLTRALEGSLALAGIGAESMVRDVGWTLMDIGRRIERAQHLVRALLASVTAHREPAVDSLVLESLLIANESVITYRRRWQTHARLDTFCELLLLDEKNPRSLAHQVTRIGAGFATLPAPAARVQARDGLLADLVDLLAEFDPASAVQPDETDARPRLAEALESLRWRLEELCAEIAKAHFSRPMPAEWLDAAGTWVPRADEVDEVDAGDAVGQDTRDAVGQDTAAPDGAGSAAYGGAP